MELECLLARAHMAAQEAAQVKQGNELLATIPQVPLNALHVVSTVITSCSQYEYTTQFSQCLSGHSNSCGRQDSTRTLSLIYTIGTAFDPVVLSIAYRAMTAGPTIVYVIS
jgi:hypothetical protein